MKARNVTVGLGILAAALVVVAYAASASPVKAAPLQASGDSLRWHIITNPGDSSKTFLIDSLVGETYLFTTSGDAHSWKKMEKGK